MTIKATVSVIMALLGIVPQAIAGPEAPPLVAVRSNLELFVWAFGVLVLVILALLGSMVHTGNQNNKTHWEHTNRNTSEIGAVKVDVAELRGAHEANHPQFRREFDYVPARRD